MTNRQSRAATAERVHYLNGGCTKEKIKELLEKIEYEKLIEREMDAALADNARYDNYPSEDDDDYEEE